MAATEPLDVADTKQVQDRARSAKDRQKDLDETIKLIMSQRNGRAWVWDQLSACGLYRISASAGDPHMTYFREGERNIGLRLMAQLHRTCPQLYAEMTKENSDG